MHKKASVFSLISAVILLLTLTSSQITSASTLNLILLKEKESYDLGEEIVIGGRLLIDGSPISDGLVTLEIKDPHDTIILLRTLNTGSTPNGPWVIELLTAFTCDSGGTPKSVFRCGYPMYFNITLKNNGVSAQHVVVVISLKYSNGLPFQTFIFHETDLEGNARISLIKGILIPSNAVTGITAMYVSALSNLPHNNGFAWCPEKFSTFTITSSGSTALTTSTEVQFSTLTLVDFNASIKTNSKGGILGNYTVYAISFYQQTYLITNQTTFQTILVGDITGPAGIPDGFVDMRDLYAVVLAYMSYPGHPKWNPAADIIKDDIIDMKDIYAVVLRYGNWGIY
ncbi:MAG: hypothetical protein QXQ94_08725 [Candidatus Bathyarchaeia archaeon]